MRGFATTVLSATLASSLAWSAQTSTDNEIVAIGCIARAVTDGSLAGSPGVPPASPSQPKFPLTSANAPWAAPHDDAEEPDESAKAKPARTRLTTAKSVTIRVFTLYLPL